MTPYQRLLFLFFGLVISEAGRSVGMSMYANTSWALIGLPTRGRVWISGRNLALNMRLSRRISLIYDYLTKLSIAIA